jgi:predicted PhzF superfamily epimerase YddE/YHI9
MKLSLVDAFTDVPFAGNPAAVCLLEEDAPASWRQSVARELGFSETAFLRPLGPDAIEIRWFTPALEVDLCGHATLASAHFLREEGLAPAGRPIRFQSKSGPLFARGSSGRIELDFPEEPAVEAAPPEGLLAALGVEAGWFGRNRLDYLALAGSEADVRGLRPDFARLSAACAGGRGVIVTARSEDSRFDFVSRFFAPSAGIDEDPVTGSAHCCLGPFWAARLGKSDLRGFQASSRGGAVSVRTGEEGRVYLGGSAVTIFRGELAVPE